MSDGPAASEAPPAPTPATHMPTRMTRRRLLKRLGIGAGAIVVVTAGGVSWRALDQGVFSPGSGPAYDPWRADLASQDPRRLVAAAILAANAHDSQPWAFRLSADRIDLYADTTRSMGAMDPLRREMYISLGCALENLVLAAGANGYAATVSLLPDAADPAFAARVDLAAAPPVSSDLFAAIPSRHTDRAAYRTDKDVATPLLDEIAGLADSSASSVAWLSPDAKSRFGQLTIDATVAIVADAEQARDDFAWYRQDWADIGRRRDGITMDAGGLGGVARVLVRLLPPSDQATMDQGWVDATRDRQVATAAVVGFITVRDATDPAQRLLGGRLLQRVHLLATTKGLSLQPLNQTFERADREADRGLDATFSRALAALTPVGWQGVTAFRMGYPTAASALSPRRPVDAVIRS